MTSDEFEKVVLQDPNIKRSLQNVLLTISPDRNIRAIFEIDAQVVGIVALFPLVVFVIKEIGLPWLYEFKRYSDLWRENFHAWVDQQYEKHGRDPVITKAAGDALRHELETIVDTEVRKSWERLVELLEHEKHT